MSDFYTDYYSRVQKNYRGSAPSLKTRFSRFWRVAERLPELHSVGSAALDIGCGEGRLCAELQRAGWSRVLGLDVSQHRIASARRTYPQIQFYAESIEEVGIPPGSLDLVVMDNVIEHLFEPARFVHKLSEYLHPKGRLVVITPNMRSGSYRLLGRRWTPELAPHVHIFLFTPAALGQLLENAGYLIHSTGSFSTGYSSWRVWAHDLRRGSARKLFWRAGQNLGNLYGRLIGAGGMLYAVARLRTRSES